MLMGNPFIIILLRLHITLFCLFKTSTYGANLRAIRQGAGSNPATGSASLRRFSEWSARLIL